MTLGVQSVAERHVPVCGRSGRRSVVDAPLGEGRVCLFGPEITFRGQPHRTFKLLFNGIYYGAARPVMPGRAEPLPSEVLATAS